MTKNHTMTLTELILSTSKIADNFHKSRSLYSVGNATQAEMGELAEEVSIAMGDSYKTPGPDGVIGEAVDLLISGLDLIYVHDRNVTEEELLAVAKPKLEKWILKIMQANAEGKLR
jgi:NTP pyrophosphatase (non-canonical NTP hydrolase)